MSYGFKGRLAVITELAVICVILLAACMNTDERIEESPLATWDPSTSDYMFASRSGAGTLEIDEHCVYLVQDTDEGEIRTLLVWPEPTTWDAKSQEIDLVDFDGGRQELHNGDLVSAGGALADVFGYEKGQDNDDLFVIPPNESCNPDQVFILGWIELNPDIK